MEIMMKQIIFIRHAKVDMDSSRPICAASLTKWEESYNTAPIANVLPDDEIVRSIQNADYVLSSTLRRSIDSLKLIEVSIDEKNSLFNEASIPVLKGSMIKMRPTSWLMLFRLLSLAGVGRWARTLKETKKDAKSAAVRLVELSQEHDNIVLMGHGVMNWLIRKELKRAGWKSKTRDVHSNWGYTLLFK